MSTFHRYVQIFVYWLGYIKRKISSVRHVVAEVFLPLKEFFKEVDNELSDPVVTSFHILWTFCNLFRKAAGAPHSIIN